MNTDDDRLDEVIEELLLARERGETAALARLTNTYPEYEHQLTAYAVAHASLSAPLSPSQIAATVALDTPGLRDRALAAAFGSTAAESAPAIPGIFARASAIGMDARQLAAATDLPRDVLVKLDRRLIALSTVPKRCLATLADALQTNAAAIQSFLAGSPGVRVAAFNYAAAPPAVGQQDTFAAALEASTLATREQQTTWQHILREEGLA
jgi:hypothetical protein